MSETARQVENLREILEVTRRMAATTDLDELLGTIVDAGCAVLNCERATIFLYDQTANELYSRVATDAETIRFPADRGIAGAAATERRVINVADAYADSRFNRDIDRQTGYRTRNLLTFPLVNLDGRLTGVLQALNKRDGAFTSEDEEMAWLLSAQAGVALHRHALLAEFAVKQRMAHDLEIARTIQQGLFPKHSPCVNGYEVAGWNSPADETGGDCYDFIPLPDGRLALMLADATGHGIGAALVIAQCRSLVRTMLSMTTDLSQVVAHVNRLLAEDLASERFVTALIGVLDPQRHCLDYLACGQGPVLLLSGETTELRDADLPPLAICDDLDCGDISRVDFKPGSTLALLTDGIYEAPAPDGDLFGTERVIDYIRRNARQPLNELIQSVYSEVQRFTSNRPQVDDVTAILVRRDFT